jgi:uncharacterized protein YsxB (DUF464 family)
MIKVELKANEIVISGHALYADKGKDIVCASVSSIVITSVNACLNLNENSLIYQEKEGFLKIEILENDNITKTLITNMVSLLKELANQYPKNINIIGGAICNYLN